MLVAMPTSAARRLVVPIKLLSLSSERQECRRVWQMNKWATCGSLLLNMQQLAGCGVELGHPRWISAAAASMGLLHSLHMIGRPLVCMSDQSIEGQLLGLLGRQATVLSLHVKSVKSSPELPSLKQLVLCMGFKADVESTLSAIASLQSL